MIKKRIFVACIDERLRLAMLLLLDQEPGMAVVGITDRLTGLLPQLEATQPEFLLLEWEMPYQELAKLLADIHNLVLPPKIIYLSRIPEDEQKTISVGADYFISENAPPDKLLQILSNPLCSGR